MVLLSLYQRKKKLKTMSILKKNSIEILNDVGLCQDKETGLFKKNCPHCYSKKVKIHSQYQTKENGERKMLLCQECKSYFAETHGTVISGLATPLSEIAKVLKTRMEGMGLNAAVRAFGYSKKTILNWEKKLSRLQETLFLYALVNEFVKLVIEGDELYTKVRKNQEASASLGLDNRPDGKGKPLYLAFKMW
jgi:transposase-like protein